MQTEQKQSPSTFNMNGWALDFGVVVMVALCVYSELSNCMEMKYNSKYCTNTTVVVDRGE